MLSLDECRQTLGVAANNLSDAEVLYIRDLFCELAEIAYETKVNPVTSLPQPSNRNKEML